ncbi:MAG: cytochrome c biogenesis protein ResB, partial [Nitrospirota bacterium]|nr:cytochrome c biogenesis protein ResB [Nitrospirota bacterium]
MTENKKKNIFDLIWSIFASVKTAVVIFGLISLSSIVGTILEQRADPEKNIKVLSKMFGLSHDAGHSVLGVLDTLGFTDMYHSWWFHAFLLLFSANLIICSLDRLPRVWKLVQEKIRPVPVDYIEKMSIRGSMTLKDKSAGIKGKIVSAMSSIGFKPAESAEGQTVQFYAEHGNYTRLGVYIVHLSILIMFIGAVL